MKKFIIYTLILITVAITISACHKKEPPMDLYDVIKNRGKIVVGVKNDAKPFGFIDENGNYNGYDIDMAKIIARNILNNENAVEFVPVTTSNKIMTVNSGNADMIIAIMSITPQRSTVVDFSHSYYMAGQTLLVKKNSKITSLQNLHQSKVGVIFGSTAEKSVHPVAPLAQVIGFKTYNEAINALNTSAVDAIAGDDSILLKYSTDNSNLKILPQKYTQEPYGIAFRKGEESKRVIKIVNDTIDSMVLDGSLNNLKRKWIK